jgi:hypothetical protein
MKRRFDVNNGKLADGGDLFNRQVYASLLSRNYRTVRLDPGVSGAALGNRQLGRSLLSIPFNNDSLRTYAGFPINNSIKFRAPIMQGWLATALTSALAQPDSCIGRHPSTILNIRVVRYSIYG